MRNDTSKDGINCEKYRPFEQLSYARQFMANLPYLTMTVLGALIFLTGFGSSFRGWIAAGLYIIYGISGTVWIILFVCPYCSYYDTRACPCGYGKIAAKVRPKKNENRFVEKFKKHIPFIAPLWIIPVAAAGIFLTQGFSFLLVVLIVIFSINSYVILPLLSKKYSCPHCPQKETCPWMGGKKQQ